MKSKKTLVVAILAVVLLAIPLVSFADKGPGKGGNPQGGGCTVTDLTIDTTSAPNDCIGVPSGLDVVGRFRTQTGVAGGVAKEIRVDVTGACNSFDPNTGAR